MHKRHGRNINFSRTIITYHATTSYTRTTTFQWLSYSIAFSTNYPTNQCSCIPTHSYNLQPNIFVVNWCVYCGAWLQLTKHGILLANLKYSRGNNFTRQAPKVQMQWNLKTRTSTFLPSYNTRLRRKFRPPAPRSTNHSTAPQFRAVL